MAAAIPRPICTLLYSDMLYLVSAQLHLRGRAANPSCTCATVCGVDTARSNASVCGACQGAAARSRAALEFGLAKLDLVLVLERLAGEDLGVAVDLADISACDGD